MKSQIEYAWAARNDNKIRLNACPYKLMKMRCQSEEFGVLFMSSVFMSELGTLRWDALLGDL